MIAPGHYLYCGHRIEDKEVLTCPQCGYPQYGFLSTGAHDPPITSTATSIDVRTSISDTRDARDPEMLGNTLLKMQGHLNLPLSMVLEIIDE